MPGRRAGMAVAGLSKRRRVRACRETKPLSAHEKSGPPSALSIPCACWPPRAPSVRGVPPAPLLPLRVAQPSAATSGVRSKARPLSWAVLCRCRPGRDRRFAAHLGLARRLRSALVSEQGCRGAANPLRAARTVAGSKPATPCGVHAPAHRGNGPPVPAAKRLARSQRCGSPVPRVSLEGEGVESNV